MADILHINVACAPMRLAPDDGAEISNILLYGEAVRTLNTDKGWAFVSVIHDGYEGYVPSDCLRLHQEKTYNIAVASTHLYPAPDFKVPPLYALYFLSPVHVTAEKANGFVRLANGGWVFEAHLSGMDDFCGDILETANMFENAPYLWGGRSVGGIDCSGLVQVSCMAAGLDCPRDSGAQSEALGEVLEDHAQAMRGDFVFFEGHVGILVDDAHILSATARHMSVVIEPLTDLRKAYSEIKLIRRV